MEVGGLWRRESGIATTKEGDADTDDRLGWVGGLSKWMGWDSDGMRMGSDGIGWGRSAQVKRISLQSHVEYFYILVSFWMR